MNAPKIASVEGPIEVFIDTEPAPEDFLAAVIKGLEKTQKELPCRFFYDERGSKLFDRICELEEYYVTRTETALLSAIGPEVAALVGPNATVVEPGSGSSMKVRLLLDALDGPEAYVAIDISRDHLLGAAESVAMDYRDVKVSAICADFIHGLEIPDDIATGSGKRLVFFPGSTIGNFDPDGARGLLRTLRSLAGRGGALLIGVDTKKDRATLEAAYDDRDGVTADFNLNILHRVRDELGGEVDVGGFAHRAVYNDALGRVEMHLVSNCDQEICVDGRVFPLKAGETIHTENSHKYEPTEFSKLAEQAGFLARRQWLADADLFSIHYLEAV